MKLHVFLCVLLNLICSYSFSMDTQPKNNYIKSILKKMPKSKQMQKEKGNRVKFASENQIWRYSNEFTPERWKDSKGRPITDKKKIAYLEKTLKQLSLNYEKSRSAEDAAPYFKLLDQWEMAEVIINK